MKAAYVGCSVGATSGGKLRLRFRAPCPGRGDAYLYAETTALDDTPENRARLDAVCQVIGGEIRAGTFDYVKWFPQGRQAGHWIRDRAPLPPPPVEETVASYFDRWLPRKAPPTVSAATFRDYGQHFACYIVPLLGSVALRTLSRLHLEDLRVQLRGRGLAEKTIKNVIGASLRALVRDAMDDEVLDRNPYAVFRWGRIEVAGPDPFTEKEREAILEWIHRKEFRSGRGAGGYTTRPHYDYFAAVRLLFFTGLRPSEAVALRVCDLEVGRAGDGGRLFVRASRVLRQDGPTKTESATRLVAIDAATAASLAVLVPLHPDPHAWLLRAPEGAPIDQDKLNRIFCDAQRVLGIRTRGLYATKDTFCSLYLSRGGRLEWLSEQTGVAHGTLRKHYAHYVRTPKDDATELRRLQGVRPPAEATRAPKRRAIVTRIVTRGGRAAPSARSAGRRRVEQKGFEPSTPTLRTWCSPN